MKEGISTSPDSELRLEAVKTVLGLELHISPVDDHPDVLLVRVSNMEELHFKYFQHSRDFPYSRSTAETIVAHIIARSLLHQDADEEHGIINVTGCFPIHWDEHKSDIPDLLENTRFRELNQPTLVLFDFGTTFDNGRPAFYAWAVASPVETPEVA